MKEIDVIIIGGGASGLILASKLRGRAVILERGERVGRKLSSTGNGQGNVTNQNMDESYYFCSTDELKVKKILSRHGKDDFIGFLKDLGMIVFADERGRVYPVSRQASAVTDLLRYNLQNKAEVVLSALVTDIKPIKNGFSVTADVNGEKKSYCAEKVVICAGGKVAKNFGTDGSGYVLAQKLGHTTTELHPSLVQLKTDVTYTKTLKGIRVNGSIAAFCGKKELKTVTGDVIFTDYGLSGDTIFRLSAFVSGRENCSLALDLLPQTEESELVQILAQKAKNKLIPDGELLCGILNNQVGRAVLKRAGDKNPQNLASLIKNFTVKVTGTLGFDYAQVTKGGIPLSEVTENLESKRHENLYFCGEILDVDGECGGYNLQWAYSSASAVAEKINGQTD